MPIHLLIPSDEPRLEAGVVKHVGLLSPTLRPSSRPHWPPLSILGSYQINRNLKLAASEDKEGYAHKARHGLQPTEEASAGRLDASRLCFLPLLGSRSELFIAAEEGDSIPFIRTADAYIALDVRSDSLGRSQLLIPDML